MKDIAATRGANVFCHQSVSPRIYKPQRAGRKFQAHVWSQCHAGNPLVANPNLSGETSVELFREGLAMVQDFAGKAGLPMAFAVVASELAGKLGVATRVCLVFTVQAISIYLCSNATGAFRGTSGWCADICFCPPGISF